MRILKIITWRLLTIPVFTIAGVLGLIYFIFSGIELLITGRARLGDKISKAFDNIFYF